MDGKSQKSQTRESNLRSIRFPIRCVARVLRAFVKELAFHRRRRVRCTLGSVCLRFGGVGAWQVVLFSQWSGVLSVERGLF